MTEAKPKTLDGAWWGRTWGGELPKAYADTQDLDLQTHRQGY